MSVARRLWMVGLAGVQRLAPRRAEGGVGGVAGGRGHDPVVRTDRRLEALLQLLQVEVEPRRLPDRRQRTRHGASCGTAAMPRYLARGNLSVPPSPPPLRVSKLTLMPP